MSPITPEEFLEENRKVWEYRNLCEAAPDLLAACQMFTKAVEDAVRALNDAGLPCPASIALAAEKARAAIAKAESGVKPPMFKPPAFCQHTLDKCECGDCTYPACDCRNEMCADLIIRDLKEEIKRLREQEYKQHNEITKLMREIRRDE